MLILANTNSKRNFTFRCFLRVSRQISLIQLICTPPKLISFFYLLASNQPSLAKYLVYRFSELKKWLKLIHKRFNCHFSLAERENFWHKTIKMSTSYGVYPQNYNIGAFQGVSFTDSNKDWCIAYAQIFSQPLSLTS